MPHRKMLKEKSRFLARILKNVYIVIPFENEKTAVRILNKELKILSNDKGS